MASATGPDQRVSSPEEERRSPPGVGALSLAQARTTPHTEEENADGEVYRTGRARVKLYARGGRSEREAAGLARGGDERGGADRGAWRDPAEPARVPRGRDTLGLAVRGARAARGGARRDRGSQEPGSEERQGGRVRTSGAAAERLARDPGLQGARQVQAIGPRGACVRVRGARRRAGEEPAEERAPLAGRRLRSGTLGLLGSGIGSGGSPSFPRRRARWPRCCTRSTTRSRR
jgi:hypothetical protein